MRLVDERDLQHNQRLLLAYFLFTTFNGVLRKWVFAGNSAVEGGLVMLQVLAPFLMTFSMRRERSWLFYFPLIPFALVLLVLAFNPLSHTIYHSIFGLLLHMSFWLMALIYVQERDSFPVERLLWPMLVSCGVESVLGLLQFTLPSDHFLNHYARETNAVIGFSEGLGTRICGTFSYLSGFGAFIVFFGMFLWALMLENRRPLLLIYALAAAGMLSAFMNGGRVVALPYAMAVVFGILSHGGVGNKLKGALVVALVAGMAVVFDLGEKLPFISNAYEAFSGRVKYGQETGESTDRAFDLFRAVIDYAGPRPGFGIGLGATYQGAIAKWGASPLLPAMEAEPERIVIEGGLFLFTVRALLLLLLLARTKIPLWFAVPIMVYILMFLSTVFNINQCFYAFFGFMLVDKMYYLKGKEAAG